MINIQDSQKIVVKKQKKVKSKLPEDTIIIENTTNIKSCEEKRVLLSFDENNIIKIQKWVRGYILRLKQLPLIMYIIKN